MQRLKKLPFHPLLIAIFPVLALLANNVGETSIEVAYRPLLVAAAIALILLLVFGLVARNVGLAAVIVSYILVLLFSYGHIYELIKNAKS